MGDHHLNPRLNPVVIVLLDAFGRPLHEFDLLSTTAMPVTMVEIASILPDLRPNVRPGTIKVVVRSQQTFSAMSGIPTDFFVRIATAEDVRELKAKQTTQM